MTDTIFILYLLYCLIIGAGSVNNNGNGIIDNQTNPPTVCELPPIYTTTPAKYPGGMVAWRSYLSKNINYPQAAIGHNIEGIVRVQMTIEKDGTISNVEFLNNPEYGLGEEAVNVIKASPK